PTAQPKFKPVYDLGPELIPNGTFDQPLSGWADARSAPGAGAPLSIVNGRLRAVGTGIAIGVRCELTGLVVGETYELSTTLYNSSTVNVLVRVNLDSVIATTTPVSISVPAGATQDVAASFVATAATMY